MALNNFNNPMNDILIMEENNNTQQQPINDQSIREDLEKNRESLKRKLQTRRSIQQLVDVGIMPTAKVSSRLYQRRKQLQMRKTQDILKNKILLRPNRQSLVEHNILSDTTAAPAIQQTQCQLKRARLADDLNNKLSVRPGVLELVANNILEIDSSVKQAIQSGNISYPSLSRPLRQKTSSFSNTTTFKRSLNSIPKSKSCLTFHEYKGPTQKAEITKVPLQSSIKSFENDRASSENHYRIQLRQQKLFLELIHHDNSMENSNHLVGNLLQQSIGDNQSFERMKLADLKSQCKKLNISSTGTKMKLIEKLKNARMKIPETITVPPQQMSNGSLSSPVQILMKSSLNDQELYQQQEQREVENQLEKLNEYDSSSTLLSIDNSNTISTTHNSILSAQTQRQNQIIIEHQDKLKQNLQQHTVVPLTPESVAQYLAQSKMSDNDLLSTFCPIPSSSTESFTNQSVNEDINFSLIENYLDSLLTIPNLSDDLDANKANSTSIIDMDWMSMPSPSSIDNNLDFTQFLNQLDTDYYHQQLAFESTCQQPNSVLFDLFPASSSTI